jgi:hypothetical protein
MALAVNDLHHKSARDSMRFCGGVEARVGGVDRDCPTGNMQRVCGSYVR